MLFRKEEILQAIAKLISNEAVSMALSQTKYYFDYPKDDNPQKRAKIEAKRIQRTANIKYLNSLRARIKDRPSQNELIALLKEIESLPIQLGFKTFTPGELLDNTVWRSTQRKSVEKSSAPEGVVFYHQKKLTNETLPRPLHQLKRIHDSLKQQLASLEFSEKAEGVLYIAEADANGQINSPVIQQFIANSRTTNKEEFPDDIPPALVDLRRDIPVNGRTFPKLSEEAIRKEIRAFLETSEKFRHNEKAKDALCNAILKNGQGLQELFVLEYAYSDPKDYHLMIDGKFYSIANNNTFYNWTINPDGDLCIDIELDMKALRPLTEETGTVYVIDSKTGELAQFQNTKDNIDNCPTIIKYRASVVFDVKSSGSAYKTLTQFQASKGTPSITEAIPRVTSFDVTVYGDKVHYTPQLTQFLKLEIMPQERPAPGNK